MGTTRKRATVVAGLAAAALAVSACGGEEGSDADAAGSEGAGGELRLWHFEGENSAMGIAWNRAIEIFEEENPDVDVVFEEKGFEQIRQTAGMVLNSSDGPDILEYAKGNATAGLLSTQGLLTDLTPVVEERGWDQMLSESLATTARYDENGVMGSGSWYGIPNYGEYVMVYYNQELFDEAGVTVPTTFADLESAMQQFVDAGQTPLCAAGAEYPAQQIWYELALSKADREWVDAFQLYQGDVDFSGEPTTFATEKFTEWVDRGFIPSDSAGLKAEDMGVAFTNGQCPMLISGSWWYGRFMEEAGFEWGTFLFPGNDLHPGSSGNIWVVPENSDQKELAYDFIDVTMRPEIQNLLGNSGGVPVAADVEQIEGEKNQELIENFNTIVENDGLAFYPDWPAPGYYDVLVSNVQNLINGSTSTEEFLSGIEGPYRENLANVTD